MSELEKPTKKAPEWLVLVLRIILYTVGLVAASYGVQIAAALLR